MVPRTCAFNGHFTRTGDSRRERWKQGAEEGMPGGWRGPQVPEADGRFTSCVALGKSPDLPGPQFPHLYVVMVRAPTLGDCCGLK